jgi:hypothetical protein
MALIASAVGLASGGLYLYKKMTESASTDLQLKEQTQMYESWARQAELETWRIRQNTIDKENEMLREQISLYKYIAVLVFVVVIVLCICRLLIKYYDKKKKDKELEFARFQSESKERRHLADVALAELRTRTATDQLKTKLELVKEGNRTRELELELQARQRRFYQVNDPWKETRPKGV